MRKKRDNLKYSMQFRAKYRQKHLAHRAVNRAVASGKLTRLPCEVCGEVKVEGHHTDYSKALDVMWLCFTYHREWHRNNLPVPYKELRKKGKTTRRLNTEAVKVIRYCVKHDKATISELAELHGLHYSIVYQAAVGISWPNVTID